MRRIIIFAVVMLTVISFVQADITSTYGIDINDKTGDKVALYQLFNSYFEDQLTSAYSSGNDLFIDRGVNPYTDWTTNGSQMVGAFKMAAAGHEMSIVNSLNGEDIKSFYSINGTKNLGKEDKHGNYGITDLSGMELKSVDDGLHLNFQLKTTYDDDIYNWSSNPDANGSDIRIGGTKRKPIYGDDMIHMVAFDITDLYNEKYGVDNNSVFMFGWEDLLYTEDRRGNPTGADMDYQDFVFIMTNVYANDPEGNGGATTPEPATLAVLGLGLAGLGLVSRRRR